VIVFEEWSLGTGPLVKVTVIRRYLSTEDICPRCGLGIRVAIGTASGGMQVYRLECLVCEWVTEALPDPEAK
jgi:hypothetical protein